MLYYTALLLLGIVAFGLLFCKIPTLGSRYANGALKVSIVIPVRNESSNIKGLLESIKRQGYAPHEIICVDDDSSDNSCNIIREINGVLLLQSEKGIECMNKKAVACQVGAANATGDLLLFLDADVRLADDAISCIVGEYEDKKHAISVQPYHKLSKMYENMSYFFNLVQLAANGCCSSLNFKNAGMYGPTILINRSLYNKIGGHSCAFNSIVDDMELGRELSKQGYNYSIFTGGKHISFRMYDGGIKSLKDGWEKNIATGANYTPAILFLLTFIWLTGCSSCVAMLTRSFSDSSYLIPGLLFYLIWVLLQHIVAVRLGSFKLYASLLYPAWFIGFCLIFLASAIKRLLHIPVVWRGRKITWG